MSHHCERVIDGDSHVVDDWVPQYGASSSLRSTATVSGALLGVEGQTLATAVSWHLRSPRRFPGPFGRSQLGSVSPFR
jgi:hypothetical protein